jgi:type IV secretion system protein VirB9
MTMSTGVTRWRRGIAALAFFAALASCATVDVERRVKTGAKAAPGKRDGPSVLVVPVEMPPAPPPEVIEVERPVYIPEPVPEGKGAAAPARGREAVEKANSAGIVKPSGYSRAAIVYDYHPDWVYETYAQPLRVCDIRLEPGERAAEAPFISDSERWMLGAGVSYEEGTAVQHIYIKPAEPGLEASLIINTDRRAYHIVLKSYKDIFMPMVRWRYPSTGMPKNYIVPPPEGGAESGGGFPEAAVAPGAEEGGGVDPRFLSFNYRITYTLFRKPRWLPELVYDDGRKTYIAFPKETLQGELPAVFENRSDMVNYRVAGNIVIIDRLIEKVTVKMGEREISIEKKKG